MVKDSPPINVSSALNEMATDHVHCRDFGHSWRPYTVEWVGQRRLYAEVLQCSRCTTQRVRLISEQGHQMGSSYRYADGYLVHGLGRLDEDARDSLRLTSLLAMMDALGVKPAHVQRRRRRKAV